MDDERPTDYPTPQDDDTSEGVVRFVGTGADSDSWAYTYLTELAEADPVRALHIIEMVLSEIAAPDQIAHVGAAQLEDVVYFSGQRLVMGLGTTVQDRHPNLP